MLTPTVIVRIADVVVVAFVVTWLVRRHSRGPSVYRRGAPTIVDLRKKVDKDGPIIGWMVRDDPVSTDPDRRRHNNH